MSTPMTDRLPPQPGEWIDRSQAIQFEFEGRQYSGFAGDTISTALWAHRRSRAGAQLQVPPAAGYLEPIEPGL